MRQNALDVDTLKNPQKFAELLTNISTRLKGKGHTAEGGLELFHAPELFDALYFIVEEKGLRILKLENHEVLQSAFSDILETFVKNFAKLVGNEEIKLELNNCALGYIYLTLKLLVETHRLRQQTR